MLTATGDGAFLMHCQEIEAALRERIPLTVLVWADDAYGCSSGRWTWSSATTWPPAFGNPDFVGYAESFGARGYRVSSSGGLLPVLTEALAADTVSVIACPVDYAENLRSGEALGRLTGPL